jgi:hypothetical protein
MIPALHTRLAGLLEGGSTAGQGAVELAAGASAKLGEDLIESNI